ncbi:response regulator [Sulfuricella sp. T08]|uniref:diguanylate cyclase n=1 Tax=Sulfuricella sp. T08 TaxID=1632857 RepID=UPI00061795D8|nr:diguanylate cyclase [Sulfuricella sp. T08]GAO35776.1 response regulator [Sulfuricella sp. T08]
MEVINQNRFKELKATGQLPSPKGVALALLNLMQQDDVTIQDIAHVVQTDPALSGRLIKFSNSLHFNTRRPIASIPEAVMVIGLPMVRQLVLGFSVLSDHRNGKCNAFNYQMFWSCSLATAIANQALSAQAKTSSEETFTCGLLSGIGRLTLATLFPDKYAKVLSSAAGAPPDELIRLEQEQFDTDHNELAAAMLKEWGFPAILIEIVYHHEDTEKGDFQAGSRAYTLVHSLNLSRSLANLCVADESSRRALLPGLYVLGARLGIDAEALMTLSDRVVSEWQQWGKILDVPTQDLPPFAEIAAMVEVTDNEAAEKSDQAELPLRILVVDDDKAVSNYLQKLLISHGHTVFSAADGQEGLEKMLEYNPQLVISDWVMPNMNGIAFCRSLRTTRDGRGLYFIILTALADEDRLVEAFEAGVDDYLVKPFSVKVLMARLRAGQRLIQLKEEISREREEVRRIASELAVTNRRLQRLALTDSLTLLPNRRYGMDSLEQEWEAAKNGGRPVTCMLIDLDRFKQINDTYGHDTGDTALKQAANILKNSSRTQDIVSRIGGEEFMVICPDTSLKEGAQYAELIRKTFEDSLINAGAERIKINVSIGVAEYNPAMPHFSALIKAADDALYQAKLNGRNKVVAYTSTVPR